MAMLAKTSGGLVLLVKCKNIQTLPFDENVKCSKSTQY